jgi:hypothetical protein
LFARMAGLQFGVEGDFPASRSWLERSEQLGDPEAAGYLATLAKDINEFDARSEVNEAEDPWTRPAHMGGVEHASESAFSEAQDPLTDPSRLAELDNAELDRLYVVAKYTYSFGRVNVMITENPITQSLASVELLYSFGGADDWLALCAAGVLNGDVEARYDGSFDFLVWVGPTPPPWWSDWTLVDDWLGEDVINGLVRREFDFQVQYHDGMRVPQRDAVAQAALIGREGAVDLWSQVQSDQASAFSVEAAGHVLGEVAARWLDGDTMEAAGADSKVLVTGALARNPNTPVDVLERLAFHENGIIRWLVTQNPAATNEILAAATLLGVDAPDPGDLEHYASTNWMDVIYDGVDVYVASESFTRQELRERYPALFDDAHASLIAADGHLRFDSRIQDDPEGVVQEIAYDAFGSFGPHGHVTEFELP